MIISLIAGLQNIVWMQGASAIFSFNQDSFYK
jgi:hypothetical protein